MAFTPVPNVAQARLFLTYNGEACNNVMHVRKNPAAAWSAADLATTISAIENWWTNDIAPLVPNTTVLDKLTGRDLTTQFGITTEISSGTAGSGGTAALPSQATPTVSWKSGLAGKRVNGRSYHVGVDETDATGNLLVGAFRTSLETAYNGLITQLDALIPPVDLVVVSYAPPGPTITPITFAVVNSTIDTQRRRAS